MGGFLLVTLTGLILWFIPYKMLRNRPGGFLPARRRVLPEILPAHDPVVRIIPREEPSTLEHKIRLQAEREFLFKLNEKICGASDVKTIADCIVADAAAFLSVSACCLYLFDSRKNVMTAEAACGGAVGVIGGSFAKGESVTGHVAKIQQPVMVNDLAANTFYNGLNRENYLRNTFISVPLIVNNELVGVINAANKKSQTLFKESDLEFLLNVARVGAIAVKNCRLVEQLKKEYLDTITTLALLIDARDAYTKRHSENVTRYSVAIAKELKLDPEQVEVIRRAGLLHDIGKIGIRDSVLLKPGKLTDEEFEQIKSHAQRGADIVATLPSLQQISFLVRHHHERFDGKGYPDGLKGDDIELGARILAVADTFDAMTTDRPYRKGLTLAEAAAELRRCKGSQFEPMIVDCFIDLMERTPHLLER